MGTILHSPLVETAGGPGRASTPLTLVRYYGSCPHSPREALARAWELREAATRRWRTYLVCDKPPEDPTWLHPVLDLGTTIVYMPRPKKNLDPRCILAAYRLCRRLRPDVFHCDNIHTSPLLGATLAGVPVRLWHKRAMQPAFEKSRRPTLRDRLAITVRLSALLASTIIAVSRSVADELMALRIPQSKIFVLTNPVHAPDVPSMHRHASRAALGYNPSDIVITTVGHAVPVKGWDLLIRAFAELVPTVPEARLLLVGSTTAPHERPFARTLTDLVQRLGVTRQARFLGHVLDVFPVLAATDIFALPSRSEGNSLALLEAQATGLPCVASRVGHAPVAVRDGVNGLLVQRNDHRPLAAALRRLATDPRLRQRLSAAAPGHIAAPSPKEHSVALYNLYLSLLRTHSPERLPTATEVNTANPADRHAQ